LLNKQKQDVICLYNATSGIVGQMAQICELPKSDETSCWFIAIGCISVRRLSPELLHVLEKSWHGSRKRALRNRTSYQQTWGN